MTQPRTHFEQIPVEAVKKFAATPEREREKEPVDGHATAARPASVILESASEKTEPYSVRPDSLSVK